MVQRLMYGNQRSLTFAWSHPMEVMSCPLPSGTPVDDPADAARNAVQGPLDYPPLPQAIIPGDRVVIAVEPGVPRAASIVAGIIQSLLEGGVDGGRITVLARPREVGDRDRLSSSETTDPPGRDPAPETSWLLAELPEASRAGIQVVWHLPDAPGGLAYLAATDGADPIYLNRLLCDADFVIPIGVQRLDDSLAYLGAAECLYPTFADEPTRRRLHPVDNHEWVKFRGAWRKEAARALWLLGVQFVVRVIPGPCDSVLAVVAGQVDAAEREALRIARKAWRVKVDHLAELVIASIDGSEGEQTWENVARALAMAARIVRHQGAVILCTEIDTPPSPTLRAWATTAESDRERGRARELPDDVLPASVSRELGQHHRLYLWSRLDVENVEEMGFTAVESEADIVRLSRGHGSCILVTGAQHASVVPRIEDE